jgi:hypothetical protein
MSDRDWKEYGEGEKTSEIGFLVDSALRIKLPSGTSISVHSVPQTLESAEREGYSDPLGLLFFALSFMDFALEICGTSPHPAVKGETQGRSEDGLYT